MTINQETFISQLEEDLPKIIRLLVAYEPQTYEEFDEFSSALVGWEDKYGTDLVSEVSTLLDDMARHLVENCGYEEFNHD